jgi:ABC-2 type transport system permease protein
MRSVGAELFVLRKRASTWVLMGVWAFLGLLFAYLLPYLAYRGAVGGPVQTPLQAMLPEDLIANVLGAKLAAIAIGLVPFVVVLFAGGAVASVLIAGAEGAAVHWPPVWELVRGLGAGWFVLATWAAVGVVLAVASRGTSLAIGLGIVYALVIEGLLSTLANEVAWLDGLVEYFLRANAYSLVTAIGVPASSLRDNGPGSFFGPFVGTWQAILVLSLYIACAVAVAAALLRRRDVS